MMWMSVRSHRHAERRNSVYAERNHGRKKAYLARLHADDRGIITRDFVARKSSGDNQLIFQCKTCDGDVYEIRRWFWDGNRQTYMGGIVYIGMDGQTPFLLTQDEAFATVRSRRVERAGSNDGAVAMSAVSARANRMLPPDIAFSAAEA